MNTVLKANVTLQVCPKTVGLSYIKFLKQRTRGGGGLTKANLVIVQ